MERSTLPGEQDSQNSASAAVQAWLQGADLDSPLIRPTVSQRSTVFKDFDRRTDTGKFTLEKICEDRHTLEDFSELSSIQPLCDPCSQLKAQSHPSPLLSNAIFTSIWRRLLPLLTLQLLPDLSAQTIELDFPSPLSIRRKRIIARRKNPHSKPLLKNLSNYSSLLSSEAATPIFHQGSLGTSPQLTTSFDAHFSNDTGTSRSVSKPIHHKRLSMPDKPLLPPLVQCQQRAGRTPARAIVRFSLPQETSFHRKSLKPERENRPRVGRSVLRERQSPTQQRSFPRPRHTK